MPKLKPIRPWVILLVVSVVALLGMLLLSAAGVAGSPALPWRQDASDGLGIAAVHASLLGLLIPVLAAFAVYVGGIRGEAERRIFAEAAKVNDIPVPIRSPFTTTQTREQRDALTHRFWQVVMNTGQGQSTLELAALGKEVLNILSSLLNQYPLPTRARDNGDNGWEILYERLQFSTIAEIVRWREDLALLLFPKHIADLNQGKLSELIEAVAAAEEGAVPRIPERLQVELAKPGLSPGARADIMRRIEISNSVNARWMLQQFLDALARAQELHSDVTRALNYWADQDRRLPQRRGLTLSLAAALIAFAAGVAVPLLFTSVSPVISVWLPLACYLAVFGYLGRTLNQL